MLSLSSLKSGKPIRVLCLGAHSDDIEIGCGGTLLTWMAAGLELHVHWCVLSANGVRADEAHGSANAFLSQAKSKTVELSAFRDGYFAYQGAELKDRFEALKAATHPDVIFTHRRGDAHQDHREVNKLTWNSFRDHLILEYEIPKWDGDIAQPNLYQPLTCAAFDQKVALLDRHFGTQRSKDWFDADTFRGLARLRGMESRANERLAEGFFARKMTLGTF